MLKASKIGLFVGLGFVGLVVLVAVIALVGSGGTKATPSVAQSSTATGSAPAKSQKRIAYKIVWEHAIPNGGFARAVSIDPSHRNMKDLKTLAETIYADTRSDRIAIVTIFDDPTAAAMFPNIATLSEADGAFFDKHEIGQYTRNANSGVHELWGNPDMPNGKGTTIKF